ncbi:CSTF_C domain-containing protein/CSTF2_hinge domain-containing protein [Cephalotus follicularis]|uniref:CSTF_C domain-containing protein/CSTF2_hinge domain-containing protein n=1 Tax=Cephalotus follicularis TaxID=3775 RepID=A0A1Q3C562_CEPFO|nr:CSTF_C domain-containing protein/CSTF2_hinge domain-containing protein [Cephalotus follicularis]
MAGKALSGEGLPGNLAGMSKNQLYDIMSQMKALIEQNQQQARQILIQNPLLTKALFQAQIMLGMVQPTQVVPNIQLPASQHPKQSAHPVAQSTIQAAPSVPIQASVLDQTSASQTEAPMRRHPQNQPVVPISSPSVIAVNYPSQSMPLHPLQTPQQPRGQMNPPVAPMSLPQSSQLLSIPPLPLHSASQPPPLHQPQMPTASSQSQQPLQTSGIPHMSLQPPLPPQPRPLSMQSFHHQYAPQMGANLGYQHPSAQHLSQPMFHSGAKPPSMVPSFLQGQPPFPSQPPAQPLYQAGGSHLVTDFSSQIGGSMLMDRGSSWMSAPSENLTISQLPGPPPAVHGQMGPGNQPARPALLSSEMEKALLQQVMSLTHEQINLLPPEQRNQVFQLQQILRQ